MYGGAGNDEIDPGEDLTVLGWGRTSENGDPSEVLQEVRVPPVSHSDCKSSYSGRTITEAMLCAGETWTSCCLGSCTYQECINLFTACACYTYGYAVL